jgi:N-acetylglucosaminyl-diphospho-decaprenol L-rhamnosyltransferase
MNCTQAPCGRNEEAQDAVAGGHKLAIIVVSWNVRDLLQQCLTSIFDELAHTPGASATVWVVDNASGDDSARMVSSQFPEAKVIANTSNRGFAAANNQALRAAGFESETPADELPDYVLLLNPDTTLLPGALHHWLEVAGARPHAGVIGGALQYPDGNFQHSAFEFPTLKQIFLDFFPLHHRLINSRLNGRYPRAYYAAERPFVVGHPLGAAMLIRRQAILDAGLLDEGYFIYAEEVDWCIRMRAAGWLSICAPTVRVVHHEAQSTRQVHSPMFVRLWESRLRLFALHYGACFNWGARRLVHLGLRHQRKEAVRQHTAGEIAIEALAQRQNALDQVAELLRRPKESFRH